jgi:hypothetical protein
MNRKIIIRSIIIAFLLALVLTVVGDFLFTRSSSSYSMKTEEWGKMDSMKHKDAMEYMDKHKIEVSPVGILQSYQDPALLKVKLKLFSLHFIGIFLGCILIAHFQLRDKKN